MVELKEPLLHDKRTSWWLGYVDGDAMATFDRYSVPRPHISRHKDAYMEGYEFGKKNFGNTTPRTGPYGPESDDEVTIRRTIVSVARYQGWDNDEELNEDFIDAITNMVLDAD